ncbi:MAG: gliding motility-associated C-terminal domain-containing protein [Bacteroidales bacterium]|nr:gliding motility-associated C-terminal domain-containing protein [Bacteroidales bacterium]
MLTKHLHIAHILALLLAATTASGQKIVSFSPPTDMCAGDLHTVTFGHQPWHDIVIQSQTASLGHSERVFLPDGVECGNPPSCAYRSPVTFNAFSPNAIVSSVNDINYVRLNIEHSNLGDLYINITCPNGQKASLLNFSSSEHFSQESSCIANIPGNHRGWKTSGGYYNQNVSTSHTYLGRAVSPTGERTSNAPCDSSLAMNAPGVGWNYCWSNNSAYQYASDTLIYRRSNANTLDHYTYGSYGDVTPIYIIDSSNVASGSHFYKPEQSFANLVGCPLNGEWRIEVIDGWIYDNGYIFEWELSLNASLIPPMDCYPQAYLVTGPWVTALNDSSFTISPPLSLERDTAVAYTFSIVSTCGDTIDTTAVIRFHPNRTVMQDTSACDRLFWNGRAITADTLIQSALATTAGCDSLHTLSVHIHPSYLLYIQDTIVENQLPHTYSGQTFTQATDAHQIPLRTTQGCDSTIIYSLTVLPNTTSQLDTAICDNLIPFLWNDTPYFSTTTDTLYLFTSRGADSLSILNLTVNPTYDTTIHIQIQENLLPVIFNNTHHYRDTAYTLHLATTQGCDSTIHFSLHVYRNHSYTYTRTICDNLLPYTWHDITFTQPDTLTITHLDQHGADSTVTLILTTHTTYDLTILDTTCDNRPYTIGGQTLLQPGLHILTLATTQGCDSIIRLHLTHLPHYDTLYIDTTCASHRYLFGDTLRTASGIYTAAYTNRHQCDSLVTLHLTVLGQGLQANPKAMPEIATFDQPDIRLYDNSHHSVSRLWEIGGYQSNQRDIVYTFPDGLDSIDALLIAYSGDGCTDTATLTLRMDRARLTVPNAFTPDEPLNRLWHPFGHQVMELEIWIYNRQGLLVRHLQGTDAQWDGTDENGTPMPQAAYIYTLNYRTSVLPDRLQQRTGTVLLLR